MAQHRSSNNQRHKIKACFKELWKQNYVCCMQGINQNNLHCETSFESSAFIRNHDYLNRQCRYFARERSTQHLHCLRFKPVIFILSHEGGMPVNTHSRLFLGHARAAINPKCGSPEGKARAGRAGTGGRGGGSAWQSRSTAAKHGISTACQSPSYP